MRLLPIILLLCFWSLPLIAQEDPSALVRQGVNLYDKGKYKEAMDVLERAKAIWPESTTILYEIALTCYQLKDLDRTIRLADSIIARKDINIAEAYEVKASAQAKQGNNDESINTLITGILETGGNDQLFYNLGVNYIRKHKMTNAEICFLNAIHHKPNHASSYLGLAELNQVVNPAKSLLAACQFLLLEPNTKRSQSAFEVINFILTNPVSRTGIMNDSLALGLDSSYLHVNAALDSVISLNKGKGDIMTFDFFKKVLKDVVIWSSKEVAYDEDDAWRGYLIPFFSDIFQSEYGDVFSNYIAQSQWQVCMVWLEDHRGRLDDFSRFLKGEENKK